MMRVYRVKEALQEQVESAANILKRGGVVAIPTDTVYGLAASAFNESAVQRIFRLKGRPRGMALPLLLADADDIHRCASDIPEVTWALVERFWPGALTLVLRKADPVPDIVTGGMGTVALRVPDHWVPRSIARLLGAPITGTSANRSGSPPLTGAEKVRAEFGGEVDLVIDGGDSTGTHASTVLDLAGERPRVLRHGAVPEHLIREVCGDSLLG